MGVRESTQFAHDHAMHHGWGEHPAGSNQTKCWEEYDQIYHVHYNGQPWCGASNCVVVHHGGWTAPAQFISVSALYNWAVETKRWRPIHSAADMNGIKEGDLTIVGSITSHEEYCMADGANGQVLSHGGNTSPGKEGSQFNGGTEAIKYRSWEELVGYVVTHDLINDPSKNPKDVPSLRHKEQPQYRKEPSDHTKGLRLWETGPRVERMQNALGIESDGYYGRTTAMAVKEWKSNYNWKGDDGTIADIAFLRALESAPPPHPIHVTYTTLHTGDVGGKVRKLQRWINQALNGHVKEDGVFGPKTEAAVNIVKAKIGHHHNGIAGPGVWNWLAQHRSK